MRNFYYAFPAFAFSIPTFPVMIMLPAFLEEVHRFEIASVGVLIFFSKIIDIITDPIVGWLNDKNFFSRKIYLILGGIFCGVALSQIFLKENISHEFFIFFWLSILYFGWTIFRIPYLSIGYDLEKNFFQRTKLSASREFFILLGLFCSLGLPMIFELSNHDLLKNIVYLAIFFGLIGLSIFCIFIPNEIKKKSRKVNFFKTLKNLKNNKPLIKILVVLTINSFANVFPMILFAFFITYVLGGDDQNRQITLFYYFLFSLVSVPFWTKLSKRLGKKESWTISLFLSAVFFILVFFLNFGDFTLFILVSCITGFCLGADLIFPPSIYADLNDIHREKFKEDISGIIFSLTTFINKISFAIVSIVVFGVLGILGFDSEKPISFEIKTFIIISYALIPILLKILSGCILTKFKFDEIDLQKVQKKLYT